MWNLQLRDQTFVLLAAQEDSVASMESIKG